MYPSRGSSFAHRVAVLHSAVAITRQWLYRLRGTPPPREEPLALAVEYQTRIDALKERLPAAAGEELVRLAGEIGQLLLERFDLRGDPADLQEALYYLMIATASGEYADYPLWSYRRGQVHRCLADCYSSLDDLDLAIDWTQRAYAGRAHPDVDTTWLAVDLAEMHWDRYIDSDKFDIDDLISALDGLSAEGDPVRRDYLRMLRGVASLERFDVHRARDDLDAGVAELRAALDLLPTRTVRVPAAAARLAVAYMYRFLLDEDVTALDHSIYIASRYALVDDGGGAGALLRLLAAGLAEVWERSGEPGDLDATINALERALASPPFTYGQERFQLWYELGRRRAQRRALTDDDLALPGIAEAYRQALGYPAPDAELELAAHEGLIAATIDDLRAALAAGRIGAAAARSRARSLVDNALAALDRLDGAPLDARAALAGRIAGLHMWAAGEELVGIDVPLMRRLLGLAAQLSHPTGDWQRGLASLAQALAPRAGSYLFDLPSGEDAPIDAVIAEALRQPQTDDVARTLEQVLAMAKYVRAIQVGELRELDLAAIALAAAQDPSGDRAAGGDGGDGDGDGEVQALAHIAEMLRQLRKGDVDGSRAAADRAIRSLHGSPPSEWGGLMMSFLRSAQELFALGTGTGTAVPGSPAGSAAGPGVAPDGSGDSYHTGMRLVEAAATAAAAQTAGDFRRAAGLLPEIERALDAVSGSVRLPIIGLLVSLYDNQAAGDADNEASVTSTIRWAREAITLAAGPIHPLWAQLCMHLAAALRRRLRFVKDRAEAAAVRAEARGHGLQAMRGHAWQVLLQSGTDYAVTAAQQAGEDAVAIAHWCVEDAATAGVAGPVLQAELVGALDAGRGLVLHAATVLPRIYQLLVAAGHRELAEEWQASLPPADPVRPASALEELRTSSDLRHRVLRTLLTANAAGPLLDPPALAEIAAALATCGVDALVYLVGGSPGFALVVRPGGDTSHIPLPGLSIQDRSPVYRYVAAHRQSQATTGAVAEEHRRAWRRALDFIGDWAWKSVIGPLAEHAASWAPGRTPRLVLVPMGPLGLIPWQAAWRPHGTGRRYAVHDLELSYLTSARQMCTLATREPVTGGDVLVVGNPDADLAFAGIEAEAIHRAFYPGGRYLGQPEERASGAGTPGEVLEWLTSPHSPRAVLHLACHAWIDTQQPARSNIRLCGQRLLVRELIEGAQRASQPLGTVFLAACTTNVAGTFYDEALSLATAFLAAGARSVFGSLWRVPDSSTSLLMFMVHHYLRTESLPPAAALRRAQLWMLDPERSAPPTMPSTVADYVDRVSAADPVSWAGFTYLGR